VTSLVLHGIKKTKWIENIEGVKNMNRKDGRCKSGAKGPNEVDTMSAW
jgi:hypothetical protein